MHDTICDHFPLCFQLIGDDDNIKREYHHIRDTSEYQRGDNVPTLENTQAPTNPKLTGNRSNAKSSTYIS